GGLVGQVSELNRHVTDQFPDLDPAAFRLVVEAQRYVSAVEDLLARVLDEGGETRNFRLLDPEDYLAAARTATVEELVAVSADLLALDAEPERPYAVELGNELIVDGAGPVTYAARVNLLADRAPRDPEPTTQEPRAGPTKQEPVRA